MAEIKKELHLEKEIFFQELFWEEERQICQIQERLRSVISWLCSRIYPRVL